MGCNSEGDEHEARHCVTADSASCNTHEVEGKRLPPAVRREEEMHGYAVTRRRTSLRTPGVLKPVRVPTIGSGLHCVSGINAPQ